MKNSHSHLSSDYESIFMAAPGMYLLLQPDAPRFTIVRANEAYLAAALRTNTDLIGRGVFEAYPDNPDDPTANGVARLRASLLHVIANKEAHAISIHRYDITRSAAQGEEFEEKYWKLLNLPVFDEHGDIQYIMLQVEEKTEQVRVEGDRDNFLGVATDLLVQVGFDGYFKSGNAACQSILGWTAEELMARPFLEFLHPHDMRATQEAFKTVVAGGDLHHFENRYRCRDGNYRWLSWNTHTVLKQGMIYCAAADITHSRRLRAVTEGQRQAIEMSMHGKPLPAILERLLLSLEENASTGVRTSIRLLSEDKKHLHTGAAPSIPEAYHRATDGLPLGEGQGSCAAAASTGIPHTAYDIAADPAWEQAKTLALAHGLRACWSTPIFSTAGEVLGSFALYFDQPTYPSTDLNQLVEIISRAAGMVIELERNLAAKRLAKEQLIRSRNDAEAANIAKSDFLANMSHEIRTPMNVIMGVADILLQHEGLTETQAGLVGTLQNSATSLLELIDDLLDLSKIEAQEVALQLVPFDLHQLLGEVRAMMTIRANQKGLKLLVTGHREQRGTLIGDPTRLRQIILKLCSNALKFTQRGGEVSIHLSSTPLADPAVVNVSIAVRDTGIGIAADKVETIFQKFTQADSSINRKFGGTGLGLSITKKLVEVMKGSITVDSTPGQGSTFTVTVPLQVDAGVQVKLPTRSPAAGAAAPHVAAPQKMLLVEDFEPNALIAGRYLRIYGYAYDLATNGLEAVERVKAGRYTAILMDVQMPELDGFEATRRIRAYEREAGLDRTPILAMTARAMAGDRESCLDADMDDYLAKPFKAQELQEKLRALVAG